MDRANYQWNDKCNQIMEEYGGLRTVISFLEQNHQQGYKAQAAQLLGMIMEQGGLNDKLDDLGVASILKGLLKHPNKLVKQNALEALEMFQSVDGEDEEEESEDDYVQRQSQSKVL